MITAERDLAGVIERLLKADSGEIHRLRLLLRHLDLDDECSDPTTAAFEAYSYLRLTAAEFLANSSGDVERLADEAAELALWKALFEPQPNKDVNVRGLVRSIANGKVSNESRTASRRGELADQHASELTTAAHDVMVATRDDLQRLWAIAKEVITDTHTLNMYLYKDMKGADWQAVYDANPAMKPDAIRQRIHRARKKVRLAATRAGLSMAALQVLLPGIGTNEAAAAMVVSGSGSTGIGSLFKLVVLTLLLLWGAPWLELDVLDFMSCTADVADNSRPASPECSDECEVDTTACTAGVQETCGNYDGDSCLEWGAPTACGSAGCGGDVCAVCSAEDHQDCSDGDVYWYDSCGVRGALVDDCTSSESCVDAGSNATCTQNEECNGVDDDGDSQVDEAPADCFREIYRWRETTSGALAWGSSDSRPPSIAQFGSWTLDREEFTISKVNYASTKPLYLCGTGLDHLLVLDTSALAGVGYDCSTLLGYVWATSSAPANTPYGPPSNAWRFSGRNSIGGVKHLFSDGGDALEDLTCEGVQFGVQSNGQSTVWNSNPGGAGCPGNDEAGVTPDDPPHVPSRRYSLEELLADDDLTDRHDPGDYPAVLERNRQLASEGQLHTERGYILMGLPCPGFLHGRRFHNEDCRGGRLVGYGTQSRYEAYVEAYVVRDGDVDHFHYDGQLR